MAARASPGRLIGIGIQASRHLPADLTERGRLVVDDGHARSAAALVDPVQRAASVASLPVAA